MISAQVQKQYRTAKIIKTLQIQENDSYLVQMCTKSDSVLLYYLFGASSLCNSILSSVL